MKERMCCVCRTKHPVAPAVRHPSGAEGNSLIRIAREKQSDGTYKFFIDSVGNANGRGAHVCKLPACIEKCIKTRALNRSFKTNIPTEIYDEVSKRIAKPN